MSRFLNAQDVVTRVDALSSEIAQKTDDLRAVEASAQGAAEAGRNAQVGHAPLPGCPLRIPPLSRDPSTSVFVAESCNLLLDE